MNSSSQFVLPYEVYHDKVLGAWIGKSIGGTIGARFEGHKILGNEVADGIWPKEIVPNDDLDIQVVWLEMLEERGCYFTHQDLIELWQDRCWYNFAEYGDFLYNVQRGIYPPASGRFNNVYFRESMGCPIRAEIWGLVAPGNSDLASAFAAMDGQLDHIEASVWAEQFWAAAVADAFRTTDLKSVLQAGRNAIPTDSNIHHISLEVPELCATFGDWRRVWLELVRKYGDRDCSKAAINFAFTNLALCTGGGDFRKTIIVAVNCGWDVDCTAATAGALLGVLSGSLGLPDDWKRETGDRLACDVNVRHKTAYLRDLATDTCKVGLEMALTRNTCVSISDVPVEIRAEVKQRLATRRENPVCAIDVCYDGEPVLYGSRPTSITLRLNHSAEETLCGELTLQGADGLEVSPSHIPVSVDPQTFSDIPITVCRANNGGVIWDKNLITVQWHPSNGTRVVREFGVAGSRHWLVYGPYWDIYDTTQSDVCPYRSEGFASHPGRTEGGMYSCFHQHVRLDREYLDESLLCKQDIPSESPFVVERGEDLIDAAHLGGYHGEGVYYFVRQVTSSEPLSARGIIGSTVPFRLWVDGVPICESTAPKSWYPMDHAFPLALGERPRRIVVKCVRITDGFRFSLKFVRTAVENGKTRGVSFLEDRLGDILTATKGGLRKEE